MLLPPRLGGGGGERRRALRRTEEVNSVKFLHLVWVVLVDADEMSLVLISSFVSTNGSTNVSAHISVNVSTDASNLMWIVGLKNGS